MRLAALLLSALLATNLSFAAPVTYNYVGNNYVTITDQTPPAGTTFNTSQHISGSLTFSSPLADMALGAVVPTSFSFSNGVHTFTNADTLDFNQVRLEVTGGVITGWDIQFNDQFLHVGDPVGKQENDLFTRNTAALKIDGAELLQLVTSAAYQGDTAAIRNSPGTWSVATGVPEPGSLGLLGAALVGAGLVRRRRIA